MTINTQQWVAKLESHLRQTSRRLVRFDTLDETLNYLLTSFGQKLTCDFVAIILKEKGMLVPRKWMGAGPDFKRELMMPIESASPDLLKQTRWWQREQLNLEEECPFIISLLNHNLSTWFSVPLFDEQRSFGFCIIGFRQFVPLIMELEQNFIEFGKDVAVALNLAIEKERQKEKIKGIEWLRENTFDGSSLEELVEKITEQAGRGTQAQTALIYLFDEETNRFIFHPPAYGEPSLPKIISVEDDNSISNYFPLLERIGENETVVPLVVNLKTIGVLYVRKKMGEKVTEADLELLHFLATHVAAMIENARLYTIQLEEKERLSSFLDHHRQLVKQTVEGEGFEGITSTVYRIFKQPVVLADRFLKRMTQAGFSEEEADEVLRQIKQSEPFPFTGEWRLALEKMGSVTNSEHSEVWPIKAGGELLGYLVTNNTQRRLSADRRVTLDYALNIYAIQFIKQKIVLDTYDQLKDHFIGHFLEEGQLDEHTLLDYSHLLQWDVVAPHRVAVLYIDLGEEQDEGDLLKVEARKAFIWDKLKSKLSAEYKQLLCTRKREHYVLIAPVSLIRDDQDWQRAHRHLQEVAQEENKHAKVFLGIGDVTTQLEDYRNSFRQALQTVRVVRRRFKEKGFSFFSDLGAYAVLYQQEPDVADLFVERYLTPLIHHGGHRGVDLVETMRTYLDNNGNLTKTAEALYIHRSTLQYRLERISSILEVDLQDAEETFNLKLALKLYDLHEYA